MDKMKVAFICVHNPCRSQIAAARHQAALLFLPMKKSALDQIFIFFSDLLTSSPGLMGRGFRDYHPSGSKPVRPHEYFPSIIYARDVGIL